MDFLLLDILVWLFNFIGAVVKSIYYMGSKSFEEVMKEDWNGRLGLIITFVITLILSIVSVQE